MRKAVFILCLLGLLNLGMSKLADCTDCVAPSSGQCETFQKICYPANSDGTCRQETTACGTSKSYSCDASSGKCSEDSMGLYTNLTECSTSCANPQKYDCDSYFSLCVTSDSGSFADLEGCLQTCGSKYSCDTSSYTCSADESGSYDNLSACKTGCVEPTNYACSTSSYTCSEDASGSFDSLTECQSNCNKPVTNPVVGMYYADWGRYRKSPYKYDSSNLKSIVSSITHLYYGFSFFCPPTDQPQPYWYKDDCNGKQPFTVTTIDPADATNIATIVGYKSQNPNLKVIASVGGWTFPSSFFSSAVSTSDNRSAFIASIKSFITQYNMDGVNFDWEYPCSEKRTDHVKITCSDIKSVTDNGGACPSGEFEHGFCTSGCEDGANLVLFLQELRTAIGTDKLISLAQSANPAQIKTIPIPEMDKYLDHWQLMNYDFFVSDITSQDVTAPNQNLYTVEELGVENWSASSAVEAVLAAGATPSKILFGVAYYGHTYQIGSGKSGDDWKKFNIPAQIEGECCGVMKNTYGGKPGKGSQQCGTLMYSEIVAAGFDTYYDNSTSSMIGYLSSEGKDSYTPAGTWINYLDEKTVGEQVKWAMEKGLGGAFAWDCTMDSIENGAYTYKLTHAIADTVSEEFRYDLV